MRVNLIEYTSFHAKNKSKIMKKNIASVSNQSNIENEWNSVITIPLLASISSHQNLIIRKFFKLFFILSLSGIFSKIQLEIPIGNI